MSNLVLGKGNDRNFRSIAFCARFFATYPRKSRGYSALDSRVSSRKANIGKSAQEICGAPRYSSVRAFQENRYVKISEEVRSAIQVEKPVVALETAIYTHGKLI